MRYLKLAIAAAALILAGCKTNMTNEDAARAAGAATPIIVPIGF